MSIMINEWEHICDESHLTPEVLESDGPLSRVFEHFDQIIGHPSDLDDQIDWQIRKRNGRESLGGGYLRFCPYCGVKLPDFQEARP